MRLPDNQPLDPVTQAELDAIDATLQGDAVDPVYAELAEIALLLETERPPAPREEFVRELDARVARRFETNPETSPASGARRGRGRRRTSVFEFMRRPAFVVSTMAAATVLALAVFVLPNVGSGSSGSSSAGPEISSSSSSGASAPSTAGIASGGSASGSAGASGSAKSLGAIGLSKSAQVHRSSGAPALPSTASSGRKVEQSTQIQLSTGNGRIDAVSQELLNLASAENTIVERSHVSIAANSNAGSFATFTLSVPDANLQAMMDKLSSLQYANVVSRQQSSQDVTDQYNDDKRALADAQALRTSLLKQLQAAETTASIDSLKAQIQTAEGQIRGDERRLNTLDHATSYSTVSVQINAANTPARKHKASAFSIGRGGHDALRVLVVAAAIALIVLAVLIPLGLLAALLSWIGFWVRQRRRERALDQP